LSCVILTLTFKEKKEMKMSGKMFGAVLGLFLLSVAGIASAEMKIGFVDAQKVLEGSKEGQRAKSGLEEYVKVRSQTLDVEEAVLKKMDTDFTQQEAVLSPEAKKAKQEEFQKKIIDFRKKQSDLGKEVQDKKVEVLRSFSKTLEGATKVVADREKIDYVFDRNPDAGLIFARATYDVTSKVIEEVDRAAAAQKAPAAKP